MRRIGLLKDKHITNNGTWYDCLNEIEQKPSVVFADFFDTTSSSGDWGGVIIQRLGKTLYCHAFEQTNNYPNGGFTIYIIDTFIISHIPNCDYRFIAEKAWRAVTI